MIFLHISGPEPMYVTSSLNILSIGPFYYPFLGYYSYRSISHWQSSIKAHFPYKPLYMITKRTSSGYRSSSSHLWLNFIFSYPSPQISCLIIMILDISILVTRNHHHFSPLHSTTALFQTTHICMCIMPYRIESFLPQVHV